MRAVLAGKGSRCSSAGGMPLPRWAAKGWAHCIEGPNVGAREAHTIWSFCDDFYHHLPRTVLFVQDDPQLATLLRDLQHGDWTTRLAESYAKRAAEAASAADLRALEPWLPDSCACAPVREAFDPRVHGYYRPMLWWMRTFLLPFANRSVLLPTRLVWPATAQFAMPRAAISARSREFYDLHARLTEVPAPLKRNVARNPRASEAEHSTVAAAANAGPIVVDLGSDPPAGSGYADAHRVATGYDLAHTFERSWFAAFDPAFPEGRPAQPRCFEPDAIAQGPMRCTAAVSCPSSEAADGRHDGGCATTDQLGLTAAPPGWRYASERCLSTPHRMRSDGCLVKPHRKSAAWAGGVVKYVWFSYTHQTPIKLVYCSRKQHASQSPCPLAFLPAAPHSIPIPPTIIRSMANSGTTPPPTFSYNIFLCRRLSRSYTSLLSLVSQLRHSRRAVERPWPSSTTTAAAIRLCVLTCRPPRGRGLHRLPLAHRLERELCLQKERAREREGRGECAACVRVCDADACAART